MFEVTKEDIKKLNDTDLRKLVGRLCEAELRKQNISPVYATYGGNQDAADGGIDVCVRIDDAYRIDGFIPRNYTGFQVKAQKMHSSEINKEMRPNGILRDCIKELAKKSGSYIIVSAQDDTSNTMLASRKDTMKKAVSDYSDFGNLKLDFYDCQRIATWVNAHASLILWVHMKTGTPSLGWEPFSNWSNSKGDNNDEYFINGVKLIKVSSKGRYDELPAVEGINQIRQSLNTPGISVRIVGLSGVGKTRLAQTLCDKRIGEHAINPDYIVYTDLSHSPNPTPETMAEVLSTRIDKTVLIIDNCAPDLHRILSEICKRGNSNVSLLTIEYDIQTDQKEEIDIYKLEPASLELIEKILQLRHKHLGQISIQRIAEFSGGNARIALALAGALKTEDDISTFSDDDLFKRLFWQGRSINEELLDVAKACSIVYSFSIEEKDNEFSILGQLVDMPFLKFHRHTQELLKRNLMQSRGKWRAVLPHALANWLANRALEDIPVNHIRTIFEEGEESRLLCSFSRRLGFLHSNEVVKKIISNWFSDDGLLKDITCLNGIGIRIFSNIAPVDIEKTLHAIEQVESHENAQKFFSKDNPHHHDFMDTLYAIAYYSLYFERCTKLLIHFALSEEKDQQHTTIRDKVKGLFQIIGSGTHAPPEMRLSVIDILIKKGGDAAELGFDLLGSALEVMHFYGHFPIDFGSRNRNSGYRPKNNEEIKLWYTCFLNYLQSLLLDNSTTEKAKEILASKLQGLLRAGMIDEITSFADKALKYGEWGAGWMSLKDVLYRDRKKIPEELRSKLEKLQKKLTPKSAYENARATLLQGSQFFFYRNRNEEFTRLKSIAYSILKNEEALYRLIPEIICLTNESIFTFAAGLAEKCDYPKRIWDVIIKQYAVKDKCNCHPYSLLGGFLWGLNSERPELVEELLDEAVENDLSYVFPLIQTSVQITKQGVKRIIRSIKHGKAPARFYSTISCRRAHETINDNDLCEIIRMLATGAEGINASIEIYSMRIHEKTINDVSSEIIQLGFDLLSRYDYADGQMNKPVTYDVQQIAKFCFTAKDPKSIEAMKAQCDKLINEIYSNILNAYHYTGILTEIAKAQPVLFLDIFLDYTDKIPSGIEQALIRNHEKPVLNVIKHDVLLKWCEMKPEPRYMIVASVIHPYSKVGEKYVWRPIALAIVKNVSEPCTAVDLLMSNFLFSESWSKLSDYYLIKIELLEALIEDVDKKTQEHIKQKIIDNQKLYRAELESEKADYEYGFE